MKNEIIKNSQACYNGNFETDKDLECTGTVSAINGNVKSEFKLTRRIKNKRDKKDLFVVHKLTRG